MTQSPFLNGIKSLSSFSAAMGNLTYGAHQSSDTLLDTYQGVRNYSYRNGVTIRENKQGD